MWGATEDFNYNSGLRTFQSTHLVWGATFSSYSNSACSSYFNPRTSCEVRQNIRIARFLFLIFQSTHLVWGATSAAKQMREIADISIHAPRVRCDADWFDFYFHPIHFNPRTSCEVRHSISSSLYAYAIFQSTHLVWGATKDVMGFSASLSISIHAPRVRCDYFFLQFFKRHDNFNPRTSCEVRRSIYRRIVIYFQFQSTHLVWGATFIFSRRIPMRAFQSTHLVWGATTALCNCQLHLPFQSTHLVWGATP